jgi:hypothetical protein
MRPIFAFLIGLIVLSGVLRADPPDEDVLRPFVPSTGHFYVDLHAGLTFGMLNGNSQYRQLIIGGGLDEATQALSYFESGSGLAPNIGVGIGYAFSPKLSVTLDAAYDAFATSNSATTDDLFFTQDAFGDTTFQARVPNTRRLHVNAAYFSLGLFLEGHFDRFMIYAGPSVGLPLSRDIGETMSVPDSGLGVFYPGSSLKTHNLITNTTGDTNMLTRVAVRFGVGYTFPMTSKINLLARLDYDLGLSELLKANEDLELRPNPVDSDASTFAARLPAAFPINAKMKLSGIKAMIGVRINL